MNTVIPETRIYLTDDGSQRLTLWSHNPFETDTREIWASEGEHHGEEFWVTRFTKTGKCTDFDIVRSGACPWDNVCLPRGREDFHRLAREGNAPSFLCYIATAQGLHAQRIVFTPANDDVDMVMYKGDDPTHRTFQRLAL